MAIARIQVKQVYVALYDTVAEFIDAQEDVELVMTKTFAALAKTDAYKWNRSFHETVDRLEQYHRTKGGG